MFTWLSRTVASHDCRHIFLLQLFKPKDEKLDQFWIDFNVESECVSFFVDDPQVYIINNFFCSAWVVAVAIFLKEQTKHV